MQIKRKKTRSIEDLGDNTSSAFLRLSQGASVKEKMMTERMHCTLLLYSLRATAVGGKRSNVTSGANSTLLTFLLWILLKCKYMVQNWSHKYVVVFWLLNVPATCECISRTDLLRQVHVLPHWDRSCRSNFLCHPVTVYWHRTNQSKHWPYNARRLAG